MSVVLRLQAIVLARPAEAGEPKRRLRAEVLVLVLWVGLGLAVGAKAVFFPTHHSVWPVFAAAAQHSWAGQPLYAYYPGLDQYRYSPGFAFALIPLTALPNGLGGCVWGMFGVGLLYTGLRALHRYALPTAGVGQSAFLALSALGAAPMIWNLQSNALVLALIAFGTAAVARGRWWPAAFLLAAPGFIKVWPAAVALLLAALWPKPLVGRLVIAAAVLAAAPCLLAPEAAARQYADWWHATVASQAVRWPGYRDALTVLQLAELPLSAPEYRLLQLVGAGGVLVVGLVCRQRAGRREVLAATLGSWICWQLVLGTGSERSTYCLAIPLLGWWTLRAWKTGQGRYWAGLSFAALLTFSFGDAERAVGRWLPGMAAILPLSGASLAGWLALYALPPPRALRRAMIAVKRVPIVHQTVASTNRLPLAEGLRQHTEKSLTRSTNVS